MKLHLLAGILLFVVSGCRPDSGGSENEHGHSAVAPGKPDAHGHSHGHEEKGASGVSFKEGRGILMKEENRKLLGLEVADISERRFANQLSFTVQLFRDQHRHARDVANHSECFVEGSGWMSTNAAALLKPGLPVEWFDGTNAVPGGAVRSVQRSPASPEAEIVVGVSNAASILKPGQFVPVRVTLQGESSGPAVPVSALLRTSEGTFVYTVNGDAYFRTAVNVGAETGGWAEITDGLLPGDQVVIRPVETLWLIELRATKGGGHSH